MFTGKGVARYTFPFLWAPRLIMLLVRPCVCAPGLSYRIFWGLLGPSSSPLVFVPRLDVSC